MAGGHAPHRVPGEELAEWLLGFVTSTARAEAIVGDLAEQAEGSTAWFWQCTVRIAAACARQNLFSLATTRETETFSDPFGFLSTIWRHKWRLVTCVLVSVVGTRIALSFYPARYRSNTVLVRMPAGVPDEYVHASQGTSLSAERINTIQRVMLSRTRLEPIVTEFDLYADARKRDLMEDILQRMRDDIRVEIVGHDALRIGFDGSDPRVVQRVVERLTSLFINENLNDRQRIAQNTSLFIESQLVDTHQRLNDLEAAINARKKAGHQMSKAESIEFDVLQQQYRDLLSKRQTATIAASLETRQIGEQFRLVEAARIPTEPIAPNREAATAGGAVAGLGVGVVLIGINARRRRIADDDPSTTRSYT